MVGPKMQESTCSKEIVLKQSFNESAKIVLSKSIFYAKNQRKFFKKKSFKNNNLGDHFL